MKSESKVMKLIEDSAGASLRTKLLDEYHAIKLARARLISWHKIGKALGHNASAVRRGWLDVERLIKEGDIPVPPRADESAAGAKTPAPAPAPASQSPSPGQVVAPAHQAAAQPAQAPATVPAPAGRKPTTQEILARSRAARGEDPGQPQSEEETGLAELRSMGVDVSHLEPKK